MPQAPTICPTTSHRFATAAASSAEASAASTHPRHAPSRLHRGAARRSTVSTVSDLARNVSTVLELFDDTRLLISGSVLAGATSINSHVGEETAEDLFRAFDVPDFEDPQRRSKKMRALQRTKQREYYEDTCGGTAGSTHQVDHFHELQAGGADKWCRNLVAIPTLINNCLGKMIGGGEGMGLTVLDDW